jgi:hypothetical protein
MLALFLLGEAPDSKLSLIKTVEYSLVAPWWRWDTINYVHIAQFGYNYDQYLTAFLPLYPALIKLGGLLTNNVDNTLGLTFGAFLITSACYLLALLFMFKLVTRHYNEKVAKYSCLALALFPMSFFYLMPYTEALFLLLVLSCFYCVSYPTPKTIKIEEQTGANLAENETLPSQRPKNRWFLACILATVAALVRMQGVLLVLPLLYLYYKRYGFKTTRHFWGLALIGVGPLLFQLYVTVGIAAPNNLESLARAWNKHLALPIDTLITTVIAILRPESSNAFILNTWGLLNLAIIVSLLWSKRRELRIEYHIYAWSTILMYLSVKADQSDVTYSLERYLILIFPAFIAGGLWINEITATGKRKLVQPLLFCICFALQSLFYVGFAWGVWLG